MVIGLGLALTVAALPGLRFVGLGVFMERLLGLGLGDVEGFGVRIARCPWALAWGDVEGFGVLRR